MKKRSIYLISLFLVLTMSGQETVLQAQHISAGPAWFNYLPLPNQFKASQYFNGIKQATFYSKDTKSFLLDFSSNRVYLLRTDPELEIETHKEWVRQTEETQYASFTCGKARRFANLKHFAYTCNFPNIKVFRILYEGKELEDPFPSCFEDTSIEILLIYSSNVKSIRNFKKSPLPKHLWSVHLEMLWYHSRRVRLGFLEKLAEVDSLKSLVFKYQQDISNWEVTPDYGEYCIDTTSKPKKRWFFTLPPKLTALKNLEELSIPNVDLLKKKNIKVLSQMTSLKRLAVHACPKEKFEYQELAKLSFLEELYLIHPYTRREFSKKLLSMLKKYLPNTKIITK